MPGSVPFGSGRFGRPDLGAALYAGLPEWMRTQDTGDLAWLFGVFGEAWNEIYDAGAIIDQVDPRTARGDDAEIEIEITAASGADGRYVVSVSPASALLGVRRGWQMSSAAFGARRMLVLEPRADTGELLLRGGDLPALGSYVLRPQAMLPQAVQALGLNVDGVAGDDVVRAWALRSWWWLAARGSDAAIEFVARLYGFTVEIRRLWKVSRIFDSFVEGDTFTGGDGRLWSRVPIYTASDAEIAYPDVARLVGFNLDVLPATSNALEWDCEVAEVEAIADDDLATFRLDLAAGQAEPLFVELGAMGGWPDNTYVGIVRDPSRWCLLDSAGVRHWLEAVPTISLSDEDVPTVSLRVAGFIQPALGAGTLEFRGVELSTPDFHRASAIELVFAEAGAAGTDAGTAMMYARAVQMLRAVLAAHVEVVATSLED